MPDPYVLDTSAIAAFTDQEEGAAEVERLLDAARRDECQIEVCAISLMELYYIALQEKSEDEATKLIALVKAWLVRWIYPDERLLLQAGKIKATYRLSVADALIAAVAKLRQAKLVHKDPELTALATEVSLLTLPFKKKTSRRVRRVRRARELRGCPETKSLENKLFRQIRGRLKNEIPRDWHHVVLSKTSNCLIC